MKIVSAGKLVNKLVEPSSAEECTETLEEVKLAKITSMELHSTELHSAKNENKHKYSSCILCIVLFSILFVQLTLELVLILFIYIGT